MTHWLVVLLLGTMVAEASAQTYYVDATNGNDSWPGTSPDSQSSNGPWKTLAKVGLSSFKPGDSVLFKCGEVWREELIIPSSGSSVLPITFSRYGDNCTDLNKPAIVGAFYFSEWMPYLNNIYVAAVSLQQPNVNFIANGFFDLGVETSAWLTYTSDSLTRLDWLESENVAGGYLSVVNTSSANPGTAISNTFSLREGKSYTLDFKLKAVQSAQNVGVTVLRNGRLIDGEKNYDQVGFAARVYPTTEWATYSYSFIATSTEENSARLDFAVPAGQTLYVDDVILRNTAADDAVITQVFVGGEFSILAQHPNPAAGDLTNSYLPVAQHQPDSGCPNTGGAGSRTLLTSLSLTQDQPLDGAGIHIRTNNWNIDDRTVVAHDAISRAITLDRESSNNLCQDWGYYVDDKLWMLDSPGEWYYDKAERLLYLWMPDSSAPTNQAEGSYLNYGIFARGRGNLVIDNLSVRNSRVGVDVSSSANVALRNLDISDSGNAGIDAGYSRNLVVDSCHIRRSVRHGVRVDRSSNATVSNNKVTDTGVVGTPKKSFAGIFANYSNAVNIINNVIQNSGYLGIYGGTNGTLGANYIQNSCMVLDDCGAIYIGGQTYPGAPPGLPNGSVVANNIIVSVLGNNPNGRPANSRSAGQGIYLDEFGSYIQASDNTVIDTDNGFQLHKGANNLLQRNTVYGARGSAIWMQEDSAAGAMHDNSILDNKFFQTNSDAIYKLTSNSGDVNFAIYDVNLFFYSSLLATEKYYQSGNVLNNYTLPQWQQSRGLDLNSAAFAFSIARSNVLSVNSSNFIANSTFDTGTTSWGKWSPVATDSVIGWGRSFCAAGGCISLTNNSAANTAILISSGFTIEKDKSYLVSFDLRGGQTTVPSTVTVRENGPDSYSALGLDRTIAAGASWESHHFVFQATGSAVVGVQPTKNGARLDFSVRPNQTVYLDNVKVVEVGAEYANASDYSKILYNATASAQSLDCPEVGVNPTKCGQYVNFEDGASTIWPIGLPAMESKVIVWSESPFKDADHDGVPDDKDQCLDATVGASVNESGCTFRQSHPADISISLAASALTVNQGESISYTVQVTNNGPSRATGISLSGLSGCMIPVTTLDPGASTSCTVSGEANSVGTLVQNVSVSSSEQDNNTVNNGASTSVTVQGVLTATNSGSGSGTVTSNPGGINCGTTCSAAYGANTSITLTAAPVAGSLFGGWSGSCTGSGTTCTVIMDTSKTVIATFGGQPDLVVSAVSGAASGTTGSSTTIDVTTANSGTADATASVTGVYLSIDQTITSADTRLGSVTVADLPASASSVSVPSVTLPIGLATGAYYFGAIADAMSVVTEGNAGTTGESNNAKAGNAIQISALTATVNSKTKITLNWVDNASDESSFLIESSTNGTTFTQIDSVDSNVTRDASTGLSAKTLYYYRVRASNDRGNSAYSNTVSAWTNQ